MLIGLLSSLVKGYFADNLLSIKESKLPSVVVATLQHLDLLPITTTTLCIAATVIPASSSTVQLRLRPRDSLATLPELHRHLSSFFISKSSLAIRIQLLWHFHKLLSQSARPAQSMDH
ncbi:hypothetical protein KCU99_g7656, partial [Aureobasidium melanogenum]